MRWQDKRSVALIILCLQGFILYYTLLFKAWEYKAVYTIDLFHNWNNSHNKKTSHIKLGYAHNTLEHGSNNSNNEQSHNKIIRQICFGLRQYNV